MTGWIEKILKRKESHKALIQHSGNTFNVPRNTTLLQAALDQDIAFPHQCTVGTCGTCRCRLVAGKVKPILDFSYTLTREQLAAGYILACQSMLKSDVVVDLRKTEESTEPDSLARISHQVMR